MTKNQRFSNPVFEQIWKDRYQKHGETFDDSIRRVAKFCAKTETEEEQFYHVMSSGLFFPGGRTMSNAGVGEKLTLCNCFTAPQIEDSMEDIFRKVALGARTHQRGGGIGYDFSSLRPAGTPTANDAVASGPVSFMDVFNAQTATILQGNRRGANLGAMNVYHPDIEEFITAKSKDAGRLCHFNLSVMVDDAFMAAAENGVVITLHWPVYDRDGFIEHDESKWLITKTVNAKDLYEKIIRQAYDNGEPGVLFYDTMNRLNPLSYTERIVATNPCAEYLAGNVFGQELSHENYGGVCNLGSLMLHKFVVDPFTQTARIDYTALENAIGIAVRMLDNIIDVNTFPDPIYKNYQDAFRTIGLGVTGLADALVMLGSAYGSQSSVIITDYLMDFVARKAYGTSIGIAMERGAFPAYDSRYVENGFLEAQDGAEWEMIRNNIRRFGIRNAKILAVAPTGTMSLVFGNNCSSGIEPIFCLSYDRKIKMGGQGNEDTHTVQIDDYAYRVANATTASVDYGKFVTAQDLTVDEHLAILGAVARHVDMSVSKTINVPEEYTFEQTKEIYYNAWKKGIKGCTIFRPNALRPGIITVKKEGPAVKEEHASSMGDLPRGFIIDTSDSVVGKKRKLVSGCGSLHVAAFFDPCDASLLEVYLSKGSTGGCQNYMVGLSRMISLSARAGVDIRTIVDQLNSTGVCPSYAIRRATKGDTSLGSCCAMAVGNALLDMWEEMKSDVFADADEETGEAASQDVDKKNPCPECGEPLCFEGGCVICRSCGYSKCG